MSISTVTNLYFCLCVLPSVNCPCSVLGCYILPPVRRFACAATVCALPAVHPNMALLPTGITSVRSASTISRGTVWPWGTTRHSHRRKFHGRSGRPPADDHLARLLGGFLCSLHLVAEAQHELGCLFVFSCSMISKEQFEKKKNDMLDSEPWVLSGEYFSLTHFGIAMQCLYYFLPGMHRIKQMFVVAGLLNVKTVEERCIRSVFCTTTSFGHQGMSPYGSWTTTQKHMQSMFDINRIHATALCIYWKYWVLKLNWSLIFFLLALSVITVLKSLAKQERRTSFQPEVSCIY